MAERVNLPKEKVDSVVEKGWSILVGDEIERLPIESNPFDEDSFQILGICVMRHDRQKLLMACRIGEAVGREIAAALFEEETEELTIDQIHDALAELTNIFAGNIRAVLPEAYESDLPMVVSGAGLDVSIGDLPTVYEAFFRSERGIVELTMRADY